MSKEYPFITSLQSKKRTKRKLDSFTNAPNEKSKLSDKFTVLVNILNPYLIDDLIEIITQYYENLFDLLMYVIKTKCQIDFKEKMPQPNQGPLLMWTNDFRLMVLFNNQTKVNTGPDMFVIIIYFDQNTFMLQGDEKNVNYYKFLNIDTNLSIIYEFFQTQIKKDNDVVIFSVLGRNDKITKIDFGNPCLNDYVDKYSKKTIFNDFKQYTFYIPIPLCL